MQIIINGIFPWYFITHIPEGLQNISQPDPLLMLLFFFLCFLSIALQLLLGKYLCRIVPIAKPRLFLLLFAVHNAGYLPLPILTAIAQELVVVYLYFYILAFNIIFWTMPSYVFNQNTLSRNPDDSRNPAASRNSASATTRPSPKISYPLLGIIIGIILAVSNTYQFLPFRDSIHSFSKISLIGALFILGGGLAFLPRDKLKYTPDIGWYIAIRLVLYPLGMYAFITVALQGMPVAGISHGEFRQFLTVEAAVPPASNLIVIANMYGSQEDVQYISNMMLWLHAASLCTLPLILALLKFTS